MNQGVNKKDVIKKSLEIRSIDTMKYSRDQARMALLDESFDNVIDKQIKNIAKTGANYAAIDTPYDEEFRPVLAKWVNAARKYKLHVWFRGNFAGWEGWFDYPKIDVFTHIAKTKDFIRTNSDLFADGDIFTSCPECENGENVRLNDAKGVEDHKAFLIVEYIVEKEEFAKIGKRVKPGYFSMNGDLAKSIMDRNTTLSLGGIVVIDHYVKSPEKMAEDIRDIAAASGGKVVLGEFGVPLPDINGSMTEKEQNEWIKRGFAKLSSIKELAGVNYWVNEGGTTALWNEDGSARLVVKTITDFYSALR